MMVKKSQNKSVLFLDFDGVLRTGNSPYRDEFGSLFDPASVHELQRVIESANPVIVISSSWKMLGIGVLREMWRERGLPGRIFGITPSDASNEMMMRGEMPDPKLKGAEIQQWLDEHPEYTHYAILDDEDVAQDDMQRSHLVQTNPSIGISSQITDAILVLLMN